MTTNLVDSKSEWKKKRTLIVEHLIGGNFHDYQLIPIPTNVVRAHERKNVADLPSERRETVLFDDFLIVCGGYNTPYVQCVAIGDRPAWIWADEAYRKRNPNIGRWMEGCCAMGSSLFELAMCISRLRNDCTRGPTVFTFCSLVLAHLRKSVYAQLDELDTLEVKNLLTLQRHCTEMNTRTLTPLKQLAKRIELDDKVGGELINFLFEQKSSTANYHVRALLEDVIALALRRYNQTLFEWVSQATLTSDLAHEFFIWDLRKQRAVTRKEFESTGDELDWSDFDHKFVRIPELVPVDYAPVARQICNLGRYLYTMQQQHADIGHLLTQYQLDPEPFCSGRTLGDCCAQIVQLHDTCSRNILAHFTQRYDIVNFAKQLPHFFVGVRSTWIYEFAALLEEGQLTRLELGAFNKRLPELLRQALQSNWLHTSPFHAKLEFVPDWPTHFKFALEKGQIGEKYCAKEGTFPNLELHLAGDNPALKLAFPARVMEPYRKIFYHLFLLNRAKYIVNRKYFLRHSISSREEFATIHLFLRFLNVYQEYVCETAQRRYAAFARRLDSVGTLDELVQVQEEFVNEMMEQMKLDQDYLPLKEAIAELCNNFCMYALDEMSFLELNQSAAPVVGQVKKMLLEQEHRRALHPLKSLLFGCYFSAIGATAGGEPLWRLLLHVDEATAMADA